MDNDIWEIAVSNENGQRRVDFICAIGTEIVQKTMYGQEAEEFLASLSGESNNQLN